MDIILFALRTVFLVLIYVFIYIVFIHLLRDLRKTGETTPAAPVRNRRQPAPRRGGAVMLKVESAPGEHGIEDNEYELSGDTRLGRGNENDVVLPDPFASNHHAAIHLRDGQYWLEDMGSRNGTLLNGMLLTKPAVLANSDQIKVGDVILRFVRWDNEMEHGHRVRPGEAEK
ncbi:MAG: FHA domain-containing protein [Firmicutes bacterium]|nr:FHA domain-containing protein [Bacillota bacterium]